jgi:hypothetical protein
MRAALLGVVAILAAGLLVVWLGREPGPGAPDRGGLDRGDAAGGAGPAPWREAGGDASDPRLEGRGRPAPEPLAPVPAAPPSLPPLPAGRLAGYVVGPRGEAVADMTVSASSLRTAPLRAPEPRASTTTDASGRFAFESLPIGPYRVMAEPEPHVDGDGWSYDAASAGVEVPAEGVELRLGHGAMISGLVLDADGDPLPARSVTVHAGPPGEKRSVRSADCSFDLGPLPAARYVVWATSNSDRLTASAPLEVTAPAQGLTIVMPDARTVSGRLVGDDVAGFIVEFVGRRGEGPPLRQRAVTDDEGRFTIGGIGADEGCLVASRRGDARYALRRGVHGGVDGIELRLERGLGLAGRLAHADGTPVGPPIGVRVVHVETGFWRNAPVEAGRFAIGGLPPGDYRVELLGSDARLAASPVVRAGAAGVELRIEGP